MYQVWVPPRDPPFARPVQCDAALWTGVEGVQVWVVGDECRHHPSQAALLEKIPTRGGGPLAVGVRDEEPGGRPHRCDGVSPRPADRPQHPRLHRRDVSMTRSRVAR